MVARVILSHLPKTGGQWARSVMGELLGDDRYHALPQRGELPIIGIVRNPWAWYVSLFNFSRGEIPITGTDASAEWDAPILELFATTKLRFRTFDAMLAAYCNPKSSPPVGKNKIWQNRDASIYEVLYGAYLCPCDYICQTENLCVDLLETLRTLGLLEPSIERKILTTRKLNAGAGADYREYYTDETAQLIATAHAGMIANHGFKFDSEAAATRETAGRVYSAACSIC